MRLSRPFLPFIMAAPVMAASAGCSGDLAATAPDTFDASHRQGTQLELGTVHATPDHFNISFTAPLHALPALEYSTEPPIRAPGSGHWTFMAPLSSQVIEGSNAGNPLLGTYLATPAARLEPATRYYFVITVPGDAAGGSMQQYTGAFSTMARPSGPDLVAQLGPGLKPEPRPSILPRWVLLVWIAFVPLIFLTHRWTARRRLADVYPEAPRRNPGRRIYASPLVVGKLFYRNTTWLQPDDTYLHVLGIGPSSLWMPTISIPWSDISAISDIYSVVVWDARVVRLTLARDPSMRFLMWPDAFERLNKETGGRLSLRDATAPVVAGLGR